MWTSPLLNKSVWFTFSTGWLCNAFIITSPSSRTLCRFSSARLPATTNGSVIINRTIKTFAFRIDDDKGKPQERRLSNQSTNKFRVPINDDKGKPQERRVSNQSTNKFRVPNKIDIPEDQLDISFARSSGAGGQNVNKVNTKVEIRFDVSSANWMPFEVRQRLKTQEAKRINKDGELLLSSQEYRTQMQNRKDAMSKLEAMVLKAYPRPKERKMRKGVSKQAKERNREDKKRRSETKNLRKRVDF